MDDLKKIESMVHPGQVLTVSISDKSVTLEFDRDAVSQLWFVNTTLGQTIIRSVRFPDDVLAADPADEPGTEVRLFLREEEPISNYHWAEELPNIVMQSSGLYLTGEGEGLPVRIDSRGMGPQEWNILPVIED